MIEIIQSRDISGHSTPETDAFIGALRAYGRVQAILVEIHGDRTLVNPDRPNQVFYSYPSDESGAKWREELTVNEVGVVRARRGYRLAEAQSELAGVGGRLGTCVDPETDQTRACLTYIKVESHPRDWLKEPVRVTQINAE